VTIGFITHGKCPRCGDELRDCICPDPCEVCGSRDDQPEECLGCGRQLCDDCLDDHSYDGCGCTACGKSILTNDEGTPIECDECGMGPWCEEHLAHPHALSNADPICPTCGLAASVVDNDCEACGGMTFEAALADTARDRAARLLADYDAKVAEAEILRAEADAEYEGGLMNAYDWVQEKEGYIDEMLPDFVEVLRALLKGDAR
jgi:hypothetical protein